MNELVTWLRLQLDEDERVALAIRGDGYGDNDDGGWQTWVTEHKEGESWPYLSGIGMRLAHSYADNVITPQRGEHIARWDPARVLAEVVAKRRILELHEPVPSHYSDGRYVRDEPGDPQCAYCAGLCHSRSGSSCEVPDAPWPCPTIRLVAQPYAGQPGWREEWRA